LSTEDLSKSGVSAFKWSALSTGLRFLLQLMAQVILARTLGPESYGVFAIGIVVLTFANFVSGFGFSWSLLQRAEVSDDDIRFAWTWQVIVGIATMFALYFLAPLLAEYFREPRAQNVIEWLSLACLLNAAASPATYLLQRDLNFRTGGLIQVGSYAAGYVAVAVPMALLGWGTVSLVAAWLVQCAVAFVASYIAKPHRVLPLFWYPDAGAALTTGRAVFLTNVVNWVLNNLDRILIARLLNAHALGLYNVAYNLATQPNALLLGALQPAFLAAGARLQNDLRRLGRAYLQMLAALLVLTVPAFVFLALISPDIVRILYGKEWSEAGWVLGILFLAMPAYVIWGISTPVLWNAGRKNYEFALQIPVIGLGLIGFYFFAGQGIRVAATVAASMLVVRAVVMVAAAFHALKLNPKCVLPDAARGLFLAAVCVACVLTGQEAVARFGMPLLSLVASSLTTFLVLTLLILMRPQLLGEHTNGMIIRFFPRLASRLGNPSADVYPDSVWVSKGFKKL
jgi:lipopolysaccharide exporter